MSLIDYVDGDKELLNKFGTLMYFMNKEVARRDFTDYLEETCDMSLDEWYVFKGWLVENGLRTYN